MPRFSTRCLIAFLLLILGFLLVQYTVFRASLTRFHGEGHGEMVNGFKKLPSALIIGVRKGGTRALLDAIGMHPKVRVVRRETHFFDSNYTRGLDWYMQQMPDVYSYDEIVLEKTPAYFTSDLAPKRVFEMDPNMKLILIVRHPVYRTISDFTQVFYNKLEQNKTLPVLSIEAFKTDEKGNELINMEYKPITNSLYDLHISKWLHYFPITNFLFLNGDVFRANPLHELRKLEKFLGLERKISPRQLVYDYRKGFFCFKKTTKIRCLGQSKGRKHRSINDEMVGKLSKSFTEHNRKFFQLIHRSFSWD